MLVADGDSDMHMHVLGSSELPIESACAQRRRSGSAHHAGYQTGFAEQHGHIARPS
jgi:hypothetical protein